jgi:hypothetical protein
LPLIWAAISAHGYGHAAQVVPVLNALSALVPDLHVRLRTTVPASFFHDRLTVPWEMSPVQQDVGCLQDGPLSINVEATWREHSRFHLSWNARVEAEVAALQEARPCLVLADAPYLALAAGRRAGIPSAALVSLTWDLVLAGLPAPPDIARDRLLRTMHESYEAADLALRIEPAMRMNQFRRLIDIGPVAQPATPQRQALAEKLRLGADERLVLVGFGGIPLSSLPFTEADRLSGFRFLFDGTVPTGSTRFVPTSSLPFSFKSLMASVDVIMSKPGYATLVEAVALQIPLVYVRRYNFADEQPLVDYLHRHGIGVELSQADFTAGAWESALRNALAQPRPVVPPGPMTGATDAAAILAPLMQ